MCGIAGIMFKHSGTAHAAGKALIDMLDGCQHRGPDSTGFALYGDEREGRLKLRFFVGSGNDARASIERVREALAAREATIVEDETIGDNYRVVVDVDGDLRKFAYEMEHAAKVISIGGTMELAQPLFVTGFDDAHDDARRGIALGLAKAGCGYIGVRPIGDGVPWLQLVMPDQAAPSADADALIYALGHRFRAPDAKRLRDQQLLGLAVSSPAALEDAIPHALDGGFDMLLLDATGGLGTPWAELFGAPDVTILRDAIRILRRIGREEEVDLVYFGGIRSGTDVAKVIALGAVAAVLGVPVALAAGGEITAAHEVRFSPDRTDGDRSDGVANILKATAGEASMMARCTGKTNLQNLEPEDLRSLTLATSEATDIGLAGTG